MRTSDVADLRAVVLDGHPRPIVLLGAGASVTSGVPLVRQLVDLIGRHAYCWKHRRDPLDPTLVRSDWFPWVSAHDWFDDEVELQELYARHIQELLA
jgi:NAD-dependent SIR2 family protein deacetylase